MILHVVEGVEVSPKLLKVSSTLRPLFLGGLLGLVPLVTSSLAINVPANLANLIVDIG
jgi:hypothetical protein